MAFVLSFCWCSLLLNLLCKTILKNAVPQFLFLDWKRTKYGLIAFHFVTLSCISIYCLFDICQQIDVENVPDSFVLTGLVEASLLPYLGFQGREVSLDEKAELLFAGQLYEWISSILVSKYILFCFCLSCSSYHIFVLLDSSVTAVVLGVMYSITKSFEPLPDDLFCYGEISLIFCFSTAYVC